MSGGSWVQSPVWPSFLFNSKMPGSAFGIIKAVDLVGACES